MRGSRGEGAGQGPGPDPMKYHKTTTEPVLNLGRAIIDTPKKCRLNGISLAAR